jgi:hypothetical protein
MISIRFFAADRQSLAVELASNTLVDRVAHHVQTQRGSLVSQDDLALIRQMVDVCTRTGRWSAQESLADLRTSFLWTLDLLCEKLDIALCGSFKQEQLIHLRLLEVLWNGPPTFPIPRVDGRVVVGYLAAEDMPELVRFVNMDSARSKLTTLERACEHELIDMMELLVEDHLDLIAILV